MEYRIEQACNLITQNTIFQPSFKICKDIAEAADAINKPHEDYPHRVPATVEAIKLMLDESKVRKSSFNDGDRPFVVDEFFIRQLHNFVMSDCDHAGKYRGHDVKPEGGTGKEYVPHYLVTEKLAMIMPISPEGFVTDVINLQYSLTLWYKAFETIHPFVDGNGRMGGIIVAALGYINSGIWLGAEQ